MEVLKLQKENIKGLIIDLVDNGGGSMEEAIKLARNVYRFWGHFNVSTQTTSQHNK
jgi:C-terminal processing protease CtpA/Prc